MRYDAAGNLTFKTGVGNSFEYFAGTNKLKKISGGSYTPPNWDLIEYTSFDKISRVLQGTDELFLTYGSAHGRVKAVTKRSNVTSTTYYVGNLYEEEHLPTGEIKKRNYIFAGEGAVAINEQSTTSGETLRYLHKDHSGSVTAYSDKTGALVQELSYDAWGRRRHCDTWAYALNIADFNAWHARGFTAHEHLDIFEMINMDGRMYDPVPGRFLSPDPFVQAPDFTQGLNRYIYCLNNPLSFTDPSGYSWLSDNWKSLTSAIVGIVVAALPGGQGIGAAILAGALGGAAAGFTGAVLNGANFVQTVKATLTGAFWGAMSAGLNFLSADTQLAAKLFKHAFSNMWLEGIRGGNMKHGLLSGLASAAGGSAIEKYGGNWSRAAKVAANAIVGGTVEELGGGKFANGAITGAFSMLFNDLMHGEEDPPKGKNKYMEGYGVLKDAGNASEALGNASLITQELMMEGEGSYILKNKLVPTKFLNYKLMFSNLGLSSKILGKIGYVGSFAEIGINYNYMQTQQISTTRFYYRTSTTVLSTIVTVVVGGSAGFGVGLGISSYALMGEMFYDASVEMYYGFKNWENNLKSGKYFYW